MVQENIKQRDQGFIKESLKMANMTAKEFLNGKTIIIIRENMRKGFDMDMGNL